VTAAQGPFNMGFVAPSDGESVWLEPENWGLARPSPLAGVTYVDGMLKPGRIIVAAAVEGVGKSYAIDGELSIRLAVAGGAFAGTWRILRTGPVLVYSEMHRDDDIEYRNMVLRSLHLEPEDLDGRYWHQNLMLAAGGVPILLDPHWRERAARWCKDRDVIALVIDTATTASGGAEPWGPGLINLYTGLRLMQQHYPELAIVLVVHLKKPFGKNKERAITDVLGDWGKWAEGLLLMEDEGDTKTKLATFKRMGQRRIIARREGGLLVDPMDITDTKAGPKVSQARFVEAVRRRGGCTLDEIAAELEVGKRTADGYAQKAEAEGFIRRTKEPGRYGKTRVWVSEAREREYAQETFAEDQDDDD
jgi:DNA-binding MarR family transcriptional regulator